MSYLHHRSDGTKLNLRLHFEAVAVVGDGGANFRRTFARRTETVHM